METLRCINLQPHGPVVSFDTRLSKKIPEGKVLDFSERQYRMLCETVAPSVINAPNNAQIVVGKGCSYGTYDDEEGVIHVKYGGRIRQTNIALRHETSHYLDDVKGKLTSHTYYDWAKYTYRLGRAALWAAVPAAVICADIYMINDIDNTKLSEDYYQITKVVGATGIGGLLMLLPYRLHPEELRASYVSRRYSYLRPFALRPKSDYT